jgi:AcrR family transcriptional regulator
MTEATVSAGTRGLIVEAADELFYQRGFEKTSFADIAAKVQISRGNFYYHFRSKDDILAAVIAHRTAQTQALLDSWAAGAGTPLLRLERFAEMLVRNQRDIERFGCPVGTMCAELGKLEHPAQGEATMIFGQFRRWLRTQFVALGRARDEADALALHLLARSQGIATLAQALHDRRFLEREVAQLLAWLRSLRPARRQGSARAPS